MLRRTLQTLLTLALLSAPGIAFAESSPVDADGDPDAKKEAEGALKLDMREFLGSQYVYPSIYEENTLSSNKNFIQYRAKEKWATGISEVKIQVYKVDTNILWERSDLPITTDNNWADAGFKTRMNQAGARDRYNNPVKDANDKIKFLDPDSDYTVKLTITTKDNKTITATTTFSARPRWVGWTNENNDPAMLGFKLYTWRKYSKNLGDSPVNRDPANEGHLYFGPNGMSINDAYDCLTPTAWLGINAHGEDGFVTLFGTPHNGYKGNSHDADHSKGTRNGTNPIYDVTDHAEVHGGLRYLFSCHSGGVSAPFTYTVIRSLKNSTTQTIGGGNVIYGYTKNMGFICPYFTFNPVFNTNASDVNTMKFIIETYSIPEELNAKGVTWLPLIPRPWVNWITNHECDNFLPVDGTTYQLADIATRAVNKYKTIFPGENPTLTITSTGIAFDLSKVEINPKAEEDNSGEEVFELSDDIP